MKKLEKVDLILKKETVLEYDEKIKSTENVIDFIIAHEELDLKAEIELYLVVLNIKNQVLGYSQIAHGGLKETVIDMKNIFKRVLLLNGAKIILIKNNPSRNTGFSVADKNLKRELQNACNIMGIEFLDFILTEKRYTSLFSQD